MERAFFGRRGHARGTATVFTGGRIDFETGRQQLTAVQPVVKNSGSAKRSDYFAPLTRTRHSCRDDMRVTATFANWKSGNEIGLALNVENGEGYDFVLTALGATDSPQATPSSSTQPTLADAKDDGGVVFVEIRRGGTTILRDELMSSKIAGQEIQITASRQGSELSIRINELPERRILEPFFLRRPDQGGVAVRGSRGVEIARIHAESRLIESGQSPLEKADELFRQGKFDEALTAYREQVSLSDRDTEIKMESKFKSAVCQQRLGRSEEALNAYRQLSTSQGETWSPLAGIMAWDMALQMDDESTDEIYDNLEGSGQIERAASLVPEEVRSRILEDAVEHVNFDDLLVADPNRLKRLGVAAKIDRQLSFSGAGTYKVQIQYVRALRMEERYQEAADVLLPLWTHTKEWDVLRRYCRCLEKLGRVDEAIDLVQQELAVENRDRWRFLLVRANMNFARGDMQKALDDLNASQEAYLELDLPYDHFNYAKTKIMEGLILFRQGNEAAAQSIWSEAYADLRGFQTNNEEDSVFVTIAGGLCGQLKIEDTEKLVNVAAAKHGGGTAIALLGMQRIHQSMKSMWSTRRGLQVAEEFLFDTASLRERTSGPVALGAYQYLRQNAFPGTIPSVVDEQAWLLANSAINGFMFERTLNLGKLVPLATTWEGFLGPSNAWNLVRDSLGDPFRSYFCYAMGNRLLSRGNEKDAQVFFSEIMSLDGAAPTTKTLAQQSLELIEKKQGRMKLSWTGPEPISVSIKDSSGREIKNVLVSESESIDLPAGDYEIHTDHQPDLETRPVKVFLGRVAAVSLEWKWTPAARASSIPGLLTHPAKLDGITRWQLVKRTTVNRPREIDFDPQEKQVVLVGRDNLVRISDFGETDCKQAFVHDPYRIWSVDWSPDGETIAVCGEKGSFFFVDLSDGSTRTWDSDMPDHLRCVRWDPGGDRVAVSDSYGTLRIVSKAGVVETELREHSRDCLRFEWSNDGSRLISVSSNEVLLWDCQTWQIIRTFEDTPSRINDVLWSRDGEMIAMAADREVAIFDSATGSRTHRLTDFPSGLAGALAWTADDDGLVVAGLSFSPFIWRFDQPPPTELKTVSRWGAHPMKGIQDGARMVFANENGYLFVDMDDLQAQYCHRWPTESFFGVDLDFTGTKLALIFKSGRFREYDLSTHRLGPFLSDDQNASLAYHPSKNLIVLGTQSGSLRLFDEKRVMISELQVGENYINHLMWTHSGDAVLAALLDGRVIRVPISVGDPGEEPFGTPLELLRLSGSVTDWSLSADDRYLVAGHHADPVTVVSAIDGEVVHTIDKLGFRSAAFTKDGSTLVAQVHETVHFLSPNDQWQPTRDSVRTPSYEYTVNLRETAPCVLTFSAHTGGVWSLDLATGEYSKIGQYTGMHSGSHVLPGGSLLILDDSGVVRKVDPKSGQVVALYAVTAGDEIAEFGAGGDLKTDLKTLDGLACFVDSADGREFIPAKDFYERQTPSASAGESKEDR